MVRVKIRRSEMGDTMSWRSVVKQKKCVTQQFAMVIMILTASLSIHLTNAQSINPNLVKCTGNKWFDTTSFQCLDCPFDNQQPDITGRKCVCNPGYVQTKRSIVNVNKEDVCTQC